MKTLYDALEGYSKKLSSADYAQLRTALIRYVIPGWGGPKVSGARTTANELSIGIQFMKTLPVEKLEEALKTQETIFNEVGAPNSSRRNYRYQLGRFIEWTNENSLIVEDATVSSDKETYKHQFRNREFPRETAFQYRKRMGVNRSASKITIIKNIGDELGQQIESYKGFRLNHVRHSTLNDELQLLKRYLGWICEEKGVSESSITINHAIPFMKLRYSEDEFSPNRNALLQAVIAERQAIREAEKLAQNVIDSIEKYRTTATKMCYRSAVRIVVVLITLSKWLYKDETRANFTDIPICVRLNELKRRIYQSRKERVVCYSLCT